ncbi:hypothetical protein BU14_2525s0001 [Porphyra umbilicalis]|uniref:Nudix hydrolase domain-containing protein n=1 Tax=Porphyra umbilicalis TaxID=2786 RepID=A0A1X6NIZ3_PORUM|nr:hypothetical protein BU14_2525s0001 [Porphyra umbilicalis]|eukprot:OSX68594.1 hypothetical protein BU14_2525s0001 [Porphyra umbilicalis]
MQDNADLGVFAVQLESCALDGWTQLPGSVTASPELLAMDVPERTDRVGQLMARLHARGLVQGWRDELHPISQFFQTETLFEMERACLPYFGLRGYGIHVNGYVRRDGQLFVWVATRSHNKATYAGLFDQMVAGGLPSGVSLIENVAKEAVEEAGVDLADLDNLTSVGSLSYRYETRKGLSAKSLFLYDLELPPSFTPINLDGEVEEFNLVPVSAVLESIACNLRAWKPNSAVVMIEFAVRHGVINPTCEPDYLRLSKYLR